MRLELSHHCHTYQWFFLACYLYLFYNDECVFNVGHLIYFYYFIGVSSLLQKHTDAHWVLFHKIQYPKIFVCVNKYYRFLLHRRISQHHLIMLIIWPNMCCCLMYVIECFCTNGFILPLLLVAPSSRLWKDWVQMGARVGWNSPTALGIGYLSYHHCLVGTANVNYWLFGSE